MTPEGLVIRPAAETDLGRIVELLTLGTVPGGPRAPRIPALSPRTARRCATSPRAVAPSWWPNCRARWSGSAS